MDPLVLLGLGLAPELLKFLSGDKDGTIADKIGKTVTTVTKGATEDDAKTALATDPPLADQLTAALKQIAADAQKDRELAEQERSKYDLALAQENNADSDSAIAAQKETDAAAAENTAGARSLWQTLAQSTSGFGWVNPILSFLITGGFFLILYQLMTTDKPLQNKDMFNVVLGAMTTAFVTVVTFYFGSSSGSKNKDKALLQGVTRQASEGPAAAGVPEKHAPAGGSASTKTPGKGTAQQGATAAKLTSTFDTLAPRIMSDLTKDFSLTTTQAAGVLGNIGLECSGFRQMQEVHPIGGGLGGYGWCQWTGPRRRDFESWVKQQGFDVDSYDANYGFLKHELSTSEGRALKSLRGTTTLADATRVFMLDYERPGVENLASRLGWAQRAYKLLPTA